MSLSLFTHHLMDAKQDEKMLLRVILFLAELVRHHADGLRLYTNYRQQCKERELTPATEEQFVDYLIHFNRCRVDYYRKNGRYMFVTRYHKLTEQQARTVQEKLGFSPVAYDFLDYGIIRSTDGVKTQWYCYDNAD